MKRVTLFVLFMIMLISFGCAPADATPSVSASAQASGSASQTAAPTASPTPAPTPSPTPVPVLREGMENGDVAALQEALISLGYLRSDAPTGFFGSATKQAVLLFQRQNGLAQDGIAGAQVQELIESGDAKECVAPLAGYVIGLDPGHQAHANADQEPVSPGSSDTKKKVTSGTQGRWSGVPEYQVNLDVALLLRGLLQEQGATVIMTRDTNDVDISNSERAQVFNNAGTDYALRLHCNGNDNTDTHGAFMLVPKDNPYLDACNEAAELLLDAYCAETGAKNLGITARSDQAGFNWCERMIINIEMGYLTNEAEDKALTDSAYQKKMARGLLSGILAYFENK